MPDKKTVYEPQDAPHQNLGLPGEFPYVRGNDSGANQWTSRQFAGFGDAAAANARLKFLLSQGMKGLGISLDHPTQLGQDSDHALARGEVGRAGVSLSTPDDMETLFKGIPITEVDTWIAADATAPCLLAFYIAAAERQNLSRTRLRGAIQNDVLKEYVGKGSFLFSPEISLKLTTDLVQFCANELPNWQPICPSGTRFREMGATAAQEIAFTLADALEYLHAANERGVSMETLSRTFSVSFSIHSSFLREVAKLRAARAVWARIVADKFGVKEPKLHIHAHTSSATLIATQLDTNLVRVALQTLAATLGGADSIHAATRDEALGLPTSSAAALAIRTHQILEHEVGACEIKDALGGSYALEALTEELISEARRLLNEVANRDGVLACLSSGWQESLIRTEASQISKAIESGRQTIVGYNAFLEDPKSQETLFRMDPNIEAEQISRVRRFRQARDFSLTQDSLANLARGARDNVNLMPLILDAAKKRATLGEIMECLGTIYETCRG